MDSLSICTLNVRGIRNRLKRKSLFDLLKKKRLDIICLQETYIIEKDVDQWEREWGGLIFHSSVSTHSMGQVILIRKGKNGTIWILT